MSKTGGTVAVRPAQSRSRLVGVLALVAVVAWPAVAVVRLLGPQASASSPLGDQALLALGAGRALQLEQLVGPYSRFGWHHPGPALFYVLALPIWLFGSGVGLSLGTILINGGASVATVAYLWRKVGALAAMWSAAALGLLSLGLGFFVILYPWNPDVLVFPLILFSVLWAQAMRGDRTALLWAAVVGSFVVQSHISTAPFCVIMLAAAVVGAVLSATRRRGATPALTNRPWLVAGTALLVASVVPIVVELVQDQPNNVTLLWGYFVAHPGAHSQLRLALLQAADALTVIPFGGATTGAGLYVDHGTVKMLGAGAVMAMIALAGFVVARRRGQRSAQLILATAVAGAIIGIAATTRVTGGVLSYLVAWQSFAPGALIIGVGCALLGTEGAGADVGTEGTGADGPDATEGRRAQRPARASTPGPRRPALLPVAVVSVLALGLGANSVRMAIHQPALVGSDNPVALRLATAAQKAVPAGSGAVNITIVDDITWVYAATVALDLTQSGHATTVSPAKWVTLFGRQDAPGRPTSMAVTLFEDTNPEAVALSASGAVVARAGGVTEVVAATR